MKYTKLLIAFILFGSFVFAQPIKKISDFANPNDALTYIEQQPKKFQNSYELLILKTQAYTVLNDFENALKSVQTLSSLYPKSAEVKEMVANLLFWQKKYDESIDIFQSLYTQTNDSHHLDRLRIIQNAKMQPKIEAKNDKSLSSDKKKHFIEIGVENYSYLDDRLKDKREYIQTKFPYRNQTVVLRTEEIDRYHKNDKNIDTEIYFESTNKKWGFFHLSFSPTANFMSKYAIGTHIYKGYQNIEVGIGYEFSAYTNQNINMLTPEYRYYLPNAWYIHQTLYYILENQSYAISNTIGKEVENRYKYYITYVYSDSNEAIEAQDMYENTISNRLEVGSEKQINEDWVVWGNLSKEFYQNTNTDYRFDKFGFLICLRRNW